MPVLVTLNPVMVRLWGGNRFANLNVIGSTFICSETASIPTSTAQRLLTAPCPRIAPLAGLFVQTLAPV